MASFVFNGMVKQGEDIGKEMVKVLKIALNNDILPDANASSDLIEILSDLVEQEFGNDNIVGFQYLDSDKTINVKHKIEKDDLSEIQNFDGKMHDIVGETIYKLFSRYKTVIDASIQKQKGRGTYLIEFDSVMKSKNIRLLQQITYISTFRLSSDNVYLCSIRFY